MAPPVKKRKSWNRTNMKLAVEEVKSNRMGYLKASRAFNVPRTTLFRICHENEEYDMNQPLGRKIVLGNKLEDLLVQYITQMEKWYIKLTRNDVKRMAYQLASKHKLKHTFNNKQAGRKWLKGFFMRHKEISISQRANVLFARSNGFTKQNVDKFFDLLEQQIEHNCYPPNKIYNVGETRLESMMSNTVVRKRKNVGIESFDDKGLSLTICLCISANGDFIPPLIIFPRRRMNFLLMKGAPPGAIGKSHSLGWIQPDSFLDWLNHFIQHARPTKEDPILLILDGNYNYIRNIHFVDMARENFVNIISFPPHSTQKMQPLSNRIISTLESYYSDAVQQQLLINGRSLTPYEIVNLFSKVYLKFQNDALAINAFKDTGIYPQNRSIFVDEDFTKTGHDEYNVYRTKALQQRARGMRTHLKNVSKNSPGDVFTASQKNRLQLTRSQSRQCQRLENPCRISRPIHKSPPDPFSVFSKLDHQSKIAITASEPTRISDQKSNNPGISNEFQPLNSPDDDIISISSDSDASSTSQPTKTGVECIYCCGLFSYDKQGEERIQCIVCKKWVHEQCLEAEFLDFVCDFCMYG